MSSLFICQAQQLSLYNKNGEPTAYIDFDRDGTLFNWNGTPMAFLKTDGEDNQVIGFNGRFLGWYEEGVLYDKQGRVIGQSKEHYFGVTRIEPIKSIQQIIPIKPIVIHIEFKPIFFNIWSSTSLGEFLYFGKKK
ncbi:4-fold beta flower protein [Sphingobacterium sp. HJSM2_6]|uniref:4-fold beta flower protein n=1 Tax=Sphingobacterium sp. HJSM2_6 TaxID=3366264 RepID=UPI003BDA9190